MSNNTKPAFYCYGKPVHVPETSIHPRVQNGRTVFAKSNTAHPPKKTGKLEKRLQARRQAYKDSPSTKKPGSNKK